jgi:hypothetical protein
LHEYVVATTQTLSTLVNKAFPAYALDSGHSASKLAVCVGGGSMYAKHIDNGGADDTRKLTSILYLNPNWTPAHGGQLRTWSPVEVASDDDSTLTTVETVDRVVDIEPRGDRLVGTLGRLSRICLLGWLCLQFNLSCHAICCSLACLFVRFLLIFSFRTLASFILIALCIVTFIVVVTLLSHGLLYFYNLHTVFASDQLVHAVLPSMAPNGAADFRYALTIWLPSVRGADAIVVDADRERLHFSDAARAADFGAVGESGDESTRI